MNRFENGFDSYQKAIAGLEKRSENEFELKAAVMNFHHAIEVLFKHILCSKSKCLIYRDVDSWTNTAFSKKIGQNARQGEHADYTINFDETVKRVMVVYEEPIDSYVYNGFLNLSELRNALTHDEVELKIEAVEQIVVTLTQIVTAILQKHLTGAEKEKFDVFVASEPYQQTLQNLIGYNLAWRVTTISNLLELYLNRDYESLSNAEIRHLESTLSLLNVVAKKEDIFCNIDDNYYLTYISYLKQEICDLLIGHFDFIKENEEIILVIRRTDVIKNIVQEHLLNAAQYVWELLDGVSFETEETVHELLDHNSFLNNHDGSVKSFSQISLQPLGERSQPAIEASSRMASKCFIFMYFLLPHCVPATWRSRAQTSMRAELPSGKQPTTRVRRRISLFSRSMTLLVRMRVQCSLGKSQ